MKNAVISKIEKPEYFTQEALNTICTNIQFSGVDVKKILLTSVSAKEGKSYTSIHIAQTFAARGMTVLLIDADLRRSQLTERYGIKFEGESSGLANYLAGFSKMSDVIYETNIGGMYLMPIGRTVSNPIPLFSSENMKHMMQIMKEKFDIVIVDAPPVGQVIDAAVIAQHCDGIAFVVSYNDTRRRDLLSAKQQMMKTGVPILGCIINKVDYDSLTVKKYYHKSYYSYY